MHSAVVEELTGLAIEHEAQERRPDGRCSCRGAAPAVRDVGWQQLHQPHSKHTCSPCPTAGCGGVAWDLALLSKPLRWTQAVFSSLSAVIQPTACIEPYTRSGELKIEPQKMPFRNESDIADRRRSRVDGQRRELVRAGHCCGTICRQVGQSSEQCAPQRVAREHRRRRRSQRHRGEELGEPEPARRRPRQPSGRRTATPPICAGSSARRCAASTSGSAHVGAVFFAKQRQQALLLGGSWDLVSKVISPLTLVISLLTKSHDPLSRRHRRGGDTHGQDKPHALADGELMQ